MLIDVTITKKNCLSEAYKETEALILMTITIPLQKRQMKQYLKDMRNCFDHYDGDFKDFWEKEIIRQEDNYHQFNEIGDLDLDDMKGTIHTIIGTNQ